MAEKEVALPEDVFKELHLDKPKTFEKEVKLIFDKDQAVVRFPTVLTSELKLKEGDRVKVILESNKEPVRVICEIIRGKQNGKG